MHRRGLREYPQRLIFSESVDRVAADQAQRITVYELNQVDPSLRFLLHPANVALVERHWNNASLYSSPSEGINVRSPV